MPAAWCLTASRSLMKAFSPALGAGELMRRRWTAGERRKRGAERRICRCGNIFGGSGLDDGVGVERLNCFGGGYFAGEGDLGG